MVQRHLASRWGMSLLAHFGFVSSVQSAGTDASPEAPEASGVSSAAAIFSLLAPEASTGTDCIDGDLNFWSFKATASVLAVVGVLTIDDLD
jgi:hypothetical protein